MKFWYKLPIELFRLEVIIIISTDQELIGEEYTQITEGEAQALLQEPDTQERRTIHVS